MTLCDSNLFPVNQLDLTNQLGVLLLQHCLGMQLRASMALTM